VPLTVSVVVCAYTEDRWASLAGAVASARAQTLTPLEIVVAVDHNPALAERAGAELGVVVVANAGERGLSGTRNSGVAASRGDVIAFLDDDAVAAPDWLERLVAPYADPRVMGVGGAIEPRWDRGRPRGFPAEFQWVVGCTYAGMPERPAPVRNVIGANMSLRREVFGRVGGFRSGMGRVGRRPMGCEETELCIRARRADPEAVFVYQPDARVAHAVPVARASWSYFRARCFAEGVSKARVSELAGARDGLASERAYALRTLPRGVARGLADAARGDVAGLVRACAIVAGLTLTTAGYLAGALGLARA
jgi:GT2 family glycosyltransferase